ncbi:MAG: TetR/AcrR family transcriptional regulator [Pseudolysinimonas sp.]
MTVVNAIEHPSIRERRRAAVERIALDLAAAHGYDAVTVEMICDRALIAPSTFFNYFGSKHTAVLGPAPRPLDDARLAAFASGTGDLLAELMLMLVADWPQTPSGRAMLLQRIDLTERTPALRSAHHGRLEDASAQVERAAIERLLRDGAPEAANAAHMVVALSHALMHWMIGQLRIEPAIPFDELVERALLVLRGVSAAQ